MWTATQDLFLAPRHAKRASRYDLSVPVHPLGSAVSILASSKWKSGEELVLIELDVPGRGLSGVLGS